MTLSQRKARLLKRLGSPRMRAKEGLVLVEGVRAVVEALSSEIPVRFALVSPRLETTPRGPELAARLTAEAGRRGFDVVEAGDEVLDELADTEHPQGVLLVVEEPAVEPRAHTDARAILLLDAVQDPGNVGTLIRSAAAFGFDLVLALDGTADPWSTKALRAAAGAAFRVPVARLGAEEALALCRESGRSLVVAAAEGSPEALRPSSFALVVGNEGAGVRRLLRDAADSVVSVPMRRGVESLNAAVAGSILMYEFTRSDS